MALRFCSAMMQMPLTVAIGSRKIWRNNATASEPSSARTQSVVSCGTLRISSARPLAAGSFCSPFASTSSARPCFGTEMNATSLSRSSQVMRLHMTRLMLPGSRSSFRICVAAATSMGLNSKLSERMAGLCRSSLKTCTAPSPSMLLRLRLRFARFLAKRISRATWRRWIEIAISWAHERWAEIGIGMHIASLSSVVVGLTCMAPSPLMRFSLKSSVVRDSEVASSMAADTAPWSLNWLPDSQRPSSPRLSDSRKFFATSRTPASVRFSPARNTNFLLRLRSRSRAFWARSLGSSTEAALPMAPTRLRPLSLAARRRSRASLSAGGDDSHSS
mmetsp:Transcript_40891/g.128133  ORF Transcript_40891/g.128133 Transcript_40891/m.128133 type:complete len:332 (-) Transcript_40891:101-1096(-)